MEVRIRIIEIPSVNDGPSAYQLSMKEIPEALHWEPSRTIDAEVARRITAGPESDPEVIMAALQTERAFAPFFALGLLLDNPIALAKRPVEMNDGKIDIPGFERNGELIRMVDVVFNAVLQCPS
jgi:hypothetical protein